MQPLLAMAGAARPEAQKAQVDALDELAYLPTSHRRQPRSPVLYVVAFGVYRPGRQPTQAHEVEPHWPPGVSLQMSLPAYMLQDAPAEQVTANSETLRQNA